MTGGLRRLVVAAAGAASVALGAASLTYHLAAPAGLWGWGLVAAGAGLIAAA